MARKLSGDFVESKRVRLESSPVEGDFLDCIIHYFVLLCCVWVLWRENRCGGDFIGNDQRHRNARRCEMVQRVRKGNKSENAGILEQSGRG